MSSHSVWNRLLWSSVELMYCVSTDMSDVKCVHEHYGVIISHPSLLLNSHPKHQWDLTEEQSSETLLHPSSAVSHCAPALAAQLSSSAATDTTRLPQLTFCPEPRRSVWFQQNVSLCQITPWTSSKDKPAMKEQHHYVLHVFNVNINQGIIQIKLN